MLCGNLDGFIEVGTLEQIEAGDPFLRPLTLVTQRSLYTT
jgi:hypothetical protein